MISNNFFSRFNKKTFLIILLVVGALVSIFLLRNLFVKSVPNTPPADLHVSVKSFSKKHTTTPFQSWKDLIEEGKVFGFDFSDPVFHDIANPDIAKRICTRPQTKFLETRALLHNVICLEDDGESLSFAWVDKSTTLDQALAFEANKTAKALAKAKNSVQGSVMVSKIKEEKGVSYFKIMIDDNYTEYKVVAALDNNITKNLGVKFLLELSSTNSSVSVSKEKEVISLLGEKITLLKSKVK
jgi:hypothetical protein